MTRKEIRARAGEVPNFINENYRVSKTPRKTAVQYIVQILEAHDEVSLNCRENCLLTNADLCFCAAIYYIYYELKDASRLSELCAIVSSDACVKAYANMRFSFVSARTSYAVKDSFFKRTIPDPCILLTSGYGTHSHCT